LECTILEPTKARLPIPALLMPRLMLPMLKLPREPKLPAGRAVAERVEAASTVAAVANAITILCFMVCSFTCWTRHPATGALHEELRVCRIPSPYLSMMARLYL